MTSHLKATKGAVGGLIFTYTGRAVYPLEPTADMIDIEDIAHSLSNQCRFTGHVREFYSVGQHSVLCAQIVPEKYALEALLHDASEAYLSDIARPLKNMPGFGDVYHEAEAKLEEAVAKRFGLDYPMSPPVKEADSKMLWAEMRDLMPNDPPDGVDIYEKEINPWLPAETEQKFLETYLELSLLSGVGDFTKSM